MYIALRVKEDGFFFEPRCYEVFEVDEDNPVIDSPMDWIAIIEATSAEEAIRIVEASR